MAAVLRLVCGFTCAEATDKTVALRGKNVMAVFCLMNKSGWKLKARNEKLLFQPLSKWMWKMEARKSAVFLGMVLCFFILSSGVNVLASSRTFTIYGDGRASWVSVPFNDTGITTTEDLGKSIAAAFSPANGDTVGVDLLDRATQETLSITNTYAGGAWGVWVGDSAGISAGAMCKVYVDRSSDESFEWTVSGSIPPAGTVVFTLYDIDEGGNENWISLPFDQGNLTTTQDVGESIGAAYSPANGDTLAVQFWDGDETYTISSTYSGGAWGTWAGDSVGISTGTPVVVYPYRSGGLTIIWPQY
jgi:hypothetical protein